ncbi:MAG: DUF2953 domain-containing protein [Clostridiaceae bacterium]
MFKLLVFIISICIITIIPIPIKFYLFYDLNILKIKILGKDIKMDSKELGEKGKELKVITEQKKITSSDIKVIWLTLKNSKLKPVLKLQTNLIYGLDDAAITAILFGLIHSIYPFVENSITSIFKTKNIDFNLTPEFNKFFLNLELKGIIYVSLVKIIYIYILFRKNYNKKTKDIKGGIVYG